MQSDQFERNTTRWNMIWKTDEMNIFAQSEHKLADMDWWSERGEAWETFGMG